MILIQQTTEKNAKKVLSNLEEFLTIEVLQDMGIEILQTLIFPAEFYRQKSV